MIHINNSEVASPEKLVNRFYSFEPAEQCRNLTLEQRYIPVMFLSLGTSTNNAGPIGTNTY